ncbi:hypothetical protein BD311DRAFT_676375 [Dichomitus squalens]|uniref:Uncharacterized protein n=1 Tax=Dichomitus squalens TaxID=114155 RepID=A0A4Q9M5S7_9APHY|nr:hypothetical protein BD311DRAFT_676375 [Dichomitus squalens]
MAFRTRLSIGDILHRGVVWSLFGITVWGAVMIGVVHRNTLAAGRAHTCGIIALQYTLSYLRAVQEEQNEIALAEAAQAALKGRSGQRPS